MPNIASEHGNARRGRSRARGQPHRAEQKAGDGRRDQAADRAFDGLRRADGGRELRAAETRGPCSTAPSR